MRKYMSSWIPKLNRPKNTLEEVSVLFYVLFNSDRFPGDLHSRRQRDIIFVLSFNCCVFLQTELAVATLFRFILSDSFLV